MFKSIVHYRDMKVDASVYLSLELSLNIFRSSEKVSNIYIGYTLVITNNIQFHF